MPLSGCSTGLVATALVALLLLPAHYYVPELYPSRDESLPTSRAPLANPASDAWFDFTLAHFPPLDLFFTVTLLMLAFLTYLCEWIQRKIMERRIVKLNQYLGASVERLRGWDARQEQLEATLKMVQNATAEYNLLLYLLLRQHRCLPAPHPHHGPNSNCFFDKDIDDDISFLRNVPFDAQPQAI